MLAELFYPKELKKIIADLRAENDLNEEAYSLLQYQIYLRLILMPLLAILFFYHLKQHEASIVAIILLLGIWYDMHRYYKSYIGSYILGQRKEALVIKQVPMTFLRKKILAEDITTGKNIVIGPLREFWKNPKCPQSGTKIFYYQDNQEHFKPMPDIDFIKKRYCLSNSSVKETRSTITTHIQA